MSVTLSQFAKAQMEEAVDHLLALSRATVGFTEVSIDHFQLDATFGELLCSGREIQLSDAPEENLKNWHNAHKPFCPERSVRRKILEKLDVFCELLVSETLNKTDNLTTLDADWVLAHEHLLPVLINATGSKSKREFTTAANTSSLTSISRSTAQQIIEFISGKPIESADKIRISLRSTAEGIVRDLIGKLLYESLVCSALDDAGLTYVRDAENRPMSGLFHTGKVDFALPCPETPQAFIEVRKSAAGHARLYANDKCWAATSWKCRHPNVLAILVYAGPWTKSALSAVSEVYDYVIPVLESDKAATLVKQHLDGGRVLRRRIDVKITDLTSETSI